MHATARSTAIVKKSYVSEPVRGPAGKNCIGDIQLELVYACVQQHVVCMYSQLHSTLFWIYANGSRSDLLGKITYPVIVAKLIRLHRPRQELNEQLVMSTWPVLHKCCCTIYKKNPLHVFENYTLLATHSKLGR